jgi:hypothetical protein
MEGHKMSHNKKNQKISNEEKLAKARTIMKKRERAIYRYSIPSDEEIARADMHMKELDLNIDQAEENILLYFMNICPEHCYKFYLLAERTRQFRAYVFYKTNKDVAAHNADGISKKLEDYVYAELERQGRGKRENITLEFEFDSDENIKRKFNGNYYNRLR